MKFRMNHDQRRNHTRAVLEAVRETLDSKGMDYSGGVGYAANKNFDDVAEMIGVDRFMSWLVYFAKHVLAVARYCREGKLESEPIHSRIVDCIGYLCILASMISEEDGEFQV